MEQQTPPAEESVFNEADFSMAGYDKHVRNARITLYVIAGFALISIAAIPQMNDLAKKITIGLVIIIAAIFAVLGYWSKKKPFTAILIGLILFIAIQVLGAIAEPASLLQAWYVKIAVILFLILGVRNGKEVQDMQKTFGK